MKRQALVTLALLLMTSSVLANWFPGRINVFIFPSQVRVEVYNPYNAPIICHGQVFGQTNDGLIYNAFFVEQFLRPGDFRFAYVQSHPSHYFIGGWATINCHFGRYF
jgi:hypothetical protein